MNLDRFNPRVWLRDWLNRPTRREREMQSKRESEPLCWLIPKIGPDGRLKFEWLAI